jgi:hypothetical protein
VLLLELLTSGPEKVQRTGWSRRKKTGTKDRSKFRRIAADSEIETATFAMVSSLLAHAVSPGASLPWCADEKPRHWGGLEVSRWDEALLLECSSESAWVGLG